MFQSKNFKFNNISNQDMGVMMIYSQLPTRILGSQKVGKQSTTTTRKHYLGNSFTSQLDIPSFNIELTYVDECEIVKMPTKEEKIQVLNWLMPSDGQYKSFVPEENELEYFVKVTSISEQQYQNGLHITLTFQMNAPYVFIPTVVRDFNLTDVENNTVELTLENLSNVTPTYSPIIKFECSPYATKNTELTVTNHTTGETFTISNIEPSEVLYINNARKFINSSVEDAYKLNDMTGKFIKMYQGNNKITFTGNGKVFFIAHYPTLMY